MAVSMGGASRSTAGGVDISLRVDPLELRAILSELAHIPDALQQAEYQAVKKTTKTGKTKISSMYRKEMGAGVLNKKLVDQRIRLKFPSKANPVGIVTINNRGYPLHYYKGVPRNPPRQQGVKRKARARRGTARWTVHKSQGQVTGRNHFVQRDRRGQVHIMVRSPEGKGGPNATAPDDYRIKYGPGLVTIAKQFQFEDKMVVDLSDTLIKNLKSQVDRFLQRKKT